jgi:DnaJ-class molecular chaperone
MKCVCAQLAYRNNFDGSRDYKVIGKPRCPICRGSGWVRVCRICIGAGIHNSQRCVQCDGNGKVRQEEPNRTPHEV